jgi:hypothetical protein
MDEIEIRLRKHGYRRGKKGLLDYIRRLETERIPRLEAERDELLAAAADVVGSTLATLEPGDRVLVPGIVIDGIRPKEAAVLEPLVRVSSTTVFGIERRGWYRAADVVGPAPTTPDEGTDTEAWLRGLLADCV